MLLISFYSSGCYFLLLSFIGKVVSVSYPLDPLTAREIRDTVKIIESYKLYNAASESWVYNWITLKEPEKRLLLPYFLNDTKQDPPLPLDKIPRKSFTVFVNRFSNLVIEIVVNLSTGNVESWQEMPEGTQTSYHGESEFAEKISKENEQVKERCRQMGWQNMELVVAEAWAPGYTKDDPVLHNAKRPMLVYFYGKMFRLDNHYAHPFDFIAIVDVASREVKAIRNLPTHSDYDANNILLGNANACPKKTSNYDPGLMPRGFLWREVHPIHASQSCAGYTLRGNELTWQNFKMRLGFNGREGLVIHQVSYKDGNLRRPLFYRMSLAEMFVPYGDPRPPNFQKIPFDIGQFSLGRAAVNLEYTGLCQGGGKVSYLDVSLSSSKGTPTYAYSVVCIYEEDVGTLWAHLTRAGNVISRRNRRLTITTLSNVGNYDYKFSWHFYLDASIEFKSQLNGILNTNLMAPNATDTGGFGTMVYPQVNGHFHQHYFGLRLDTEIDGNLNTVLTSDIRSLKDPLWSSKNSHETGFTIGQKVLKTPLEARTNIDPAKGRIWVVQNPDKIHPCTKNPMGWKLTPFSGPPLFMRNDSPMFAKCAWAKYNVWVTKYKEDQLYPGGFYLNGTGLPEWVKEIPQQDLTNTDVVLWYIYGSSHITRVEDFPIMPAETIGFSLKPVNFFLKNPATDVPTPISNNQIVCNDNI